MRTLRLYATMLYALLLSACFHPPYNNFHPDKRVLKKTTVDAGIGAGAGAVIGSVAGNTAAGAVIGGVAGAAIGLYQTNHQSLIKQLQDQDIEYIAYGDTFTLIVPTDRYFIANTPHLNDICYKGLNNIAKLMSYYPNSMVYVAAFTDNIGTRYHKKMLSQAQAETMLTFLWAHGISAQLLHAEGYGDLHDVADNHWIHGSAFNRRIELQWVNNPNASSPPPGPYLSAMK